MAKKVKSYSQVAATEALEQLGQHGSSPEELVYHLLRIFPGFGDGQISRIKDGRGNSANDNKTVLVKNLIAYRAVTSELKENLYDEIIGMKDNAKISKHNPRMYVVSNGKDVIAYDPKINDWYENTIDLLWRDFEFLTPLAGIEKVEHIEEAEADVKSAELMAKLFDDIRRYNDIRDKDTVHSLNVFMSRLLFCFFAEDTGLFPGENLFTNTLKTHTKEDGSDLAEFIDKAFIVMSTNNKQIRESYPKFFDEFPYVNGGLFKEHFPVPVLSRRARTLIINCGEYNWKEINPDIFGSMIQAVVTPEQRSGLGMHYTSVPNIEKLIKPLFLDELEEEFDAAYKEAKEKTDKKIKSDKATQRLRTLLARLSKIKFFDPACGSGNFLIISYKRVRDLEIRIWKAMRDIANMTVLPISAISLTQFYGIEIDEYACDTAILSLWLAEHQMNVKFNTEFGVQPETLPLKPSGHIIKGNACRLDWNTVCPHTPEDEVYIMGNPPYLGYSKQDFNQKLDILYSISYIEGFKKLDYISPWFIKGAEYIKNSNSRFAFVTTNSIIQGEQVSILWPNILKDIDIYFAYKPFMWKNNAKNNAIVAVTILGLKNKRQNLEKKFYNGTSYRSMTNINPYLIEMDDIFVYPTLCPISPRKEMIKGCSPVDNNNFMFTPEEAQSFIETYPNLKPIIHKYVGAEEFVKGIERYCVYIESPEEIEISKSNPLLNKRFDAVSKFREKSTKESTRRFAAFPYRFIEQKYLRQKSIVVPQTGSENRRYIPMGIADESCVLSNAVRIIYCGDGYELSLLGLLSSYMHMVWVRAVAGRMKMDMQYGNTTCYNTFPFPKLNHEQKEELERLAQNILNIRDMNFDMTLGEMYNPESMPEELKQAHHELDLAVEKIYRTEPFQSDEERLEHLFKLYSKKTKI
ncbi:MAG: class I SAM-dependent DNA methyltransferase [Muribaculaceae bacterium]|nr:class I SAM-dependent DNA methyltransferase [Muribaculaceae bacterium]